VALPNFHLLRSSKSHGTCDEPHISSLQGCLWRMTRRVGRNSTVTHSCCVHARNFVFLTSCRLARHRAPVLSIPSSLLTCMLITHRLCTYIGNARVYRLRRWLELPSVVCHANNWGELCYLLSCIIPYLSCVVALPFRYESMLQSFATQTTELYLLYLLHSDHIYVAFSNRLVIVD